MQNQSLEAKQLYLRDNILDKGHDPESFMAYCEENQGHINLQEWTMQKLIDIVGGFLRAQSQTTFTQQELDNDEWTQQEPQNEYPKKIQIKISDNIELKPQQIVFRDEDWGIFGLDPKRSDKKQQKSGKLNETKMYPNIDPFAIEISGPNQTKTKLVKQEKNIQQKNPPQKLSADLEVRDLKNKIKVNGALKIQFRKIKDLPLLPSIRDIEIVKTEQKSKNFLKGEQTYYHIKFIPCGHIVEKRFSDLRKLKSIMHKLYPHIRMPYLEPQGWLVSSSQGKDPDSLTKYKYQVIEFFKYILITNQTLKKSKIVRIFSGLLENSGSEIKKYQTVPKPRKFLDLCLPGNQINFNQYQSLAPVDKYMNNTLLLVSEIDGHYEKLRKAIDTLMHNYELVSKSLTEVTNIFETMENSISKFNLQSDTHKELRVYEGIKQVCIRMQEQMLIHSQVFRSKFSQFFKYERQNMTTIKQINDIRAKMYLEYQRNNIQTSKISSSERSVIDGDMPIDDVCKSNKNVLRVQNMFWSHFALEATHNYWQQLRNKINEKLTLIAYDELDNENSNLNFWNTVIKRCVM